MLYIFTHSADRYSLLYHRNYLDYRIDRIVKINSKYKEDDFSNSNADVSSLNVCEHRKQAHHMCQIPVHPSSRYSVSYKHSRYSQLRLYPGSSMMMMQILSATHLLICPTNMKLYIPPPDSFMLMMQILI